MPRKIRGQHSSRSRGTGVDGKCHRKHTAGSLRKAQARVKRRGKSSPLAEQFARHEKPHAVQDKTEEGQPVRFNPRVSSHHVPRLRDGRSSRDCGTGEMNDHPQHLASKVLEQNSAYRHRNYEGRFRKRRRPSLLLRYRGRKLGFFAKQGKHFLNECVGGDGVLLP